MATGWSVVAGDPPLLALSGEISRK